MLGYMQVDLPGDSIVCVPQAGHDFLQAYTSFSKKGRMCMTENMGVNPTGERGIECGLDMVYVRLHYALRQRVARMHYGSEEKSATGALGVMP